MNGEERARRFRSTSKHSSDQARSESHVSPDLEERAARPLGFMASVNLKNSRDALKVLAHVASDDFNGSSQKEDGERKDEDEKMQDPSGAGHRSRAQSLHSAIRPPTDSPRESSNYNAGTAAHARVPQASQSPENQRVGRAQPAANSANLGAASTLTAPPPPEQIFGWADFEPIQRKIIRRPEAKALLD